MLYKVRLHAATKSLYVLPNANTNPVGITTTSLGTFTHDDDSGDTLDIGASHAMYHHVRDLCYLADIEDMASYSIYKLATGLATYPATVSLDAYTDETAQITWDFTPAEQINDTVTFASSDATKATVNSSGLITAVAAGSTTITATHTLSGKTDTTVVTVEDIAVVLLPASDSLDLSDVETLQLTWSFTNPTNPTATAVTFASSDATKATVSGTGLVTPVAIGTTTITITHTDSGKTDTCAITVVA